MIRRVLRRAIRGLVQHWLVSTLVLVVLLGGGVFALFQSGLPMFSAPEVGGFSLPGPKGPPKSTENYLKGNQTYNAELMWSSLSDEALDRFRSRGGTQQDMQRQLEVARERGSKLEQINYVGGQSLPDGTSLQFYVVATRGPSSRPDLEYVTYIFTLDRSGKISKVQ